MGSRPIARRSRCRAADVRRVGDAASYDDYDPSAHRVLVLPRNTGGGWGTSLPTRRRAGVDSPSIAASASASTSRGLTPTPARSALLGARRGQDVRAGRDREDDGGLDRRRRAPRVGQRRRRRERRGGCVGRAAPAPRRRASPRTAGRSGTTRYPSWGSRGGERRNAVAPRLGDKLALAWTTPGGASGADPGLELGGSRPDDRVVRPERPVQGWVRHVDVLLLGGTIGAVWSACRTSGRDLLSARPRHPTFWSRLERRRWLVCAPRWCRSVDADQAINESPTAVWLDGGTRIVTYEPQRRLDQLRDVAQARDTRRRCRKPLNRGT